nr:MAG TPA: hypothetical protein [Caudoviricetes sp.]
MIQQFCKGGSMEARPESGGQDRARERKNLGKEKGEYKG